MMHGREKSGPVVVAGKRANKAERSAAEPVERRAGAEGGACQNRAHRAQNRRSRRHRRWRAYGRRQGASRRHTPEAGAVCGKAARTDLCGGALSNGRPYRDHSIRPAKPWQRRRVAWR